MKGQKKKMFQKFKIRKKASLSDKTAEKKKKKRLKAKSNQMSKRVTINQGNS